MNVSHRLRQKHRGLAGRVRSAYHYDFIAVAELRFHEGRAVVDTRTFELTEIRERRHTVSSPSGNDHCPSRDGHAVVESHAVGVVFADQLCGAFRDHDLGAKLLCLGVGASGQLSTGNARWKSKVVLDSRARARLSSRRVRLDNQHIESLGSRVNGGRKTSWPAADDDDIAPVGVIDPFIEAETVGDLLIAGILQRHRAAADHDRYLRRLHVKAIEQLPYIGVPVKIEVLEGVTIAR